MSSTLFAPVALVVEDEMVIRAEITNELRNAGWEVLEANTGEGALNLLKKASQISALITDIQLTGYLSGWEVAEAVRAEHPDIPVIYASANTVVPIRQVPGSVFFEKPYSPEKVVEVAATLAQLAIRREE